MKYTLTLVSEVSGKSIEELRQIAEQKGISLPADDAEISLDIIKQIDFSLAYTMRYANAGSGKKEVKRPKATKVVDKIDCSIFEKSEVTSDDLPQNSIESQQETKKASNVSNDQVRSILTELEMAISYPEVIRLKDIQGIRNKWDKCDIHGRHKEARNYARLLDKLFDAVTIDEGEREEAYKANLEMREKICEALESLLKTEDNDTPLAHHISNLTVQWYSAGPVSEEDWKVIEKRYKAIKDRLKERKQAQTSSQKKKKNASEQVIGYVKWFDDSKGFGFAITNSLGTNEQGKSKFIDVYLSKENIVDTYGSLLVWITFRIEKSRKGYIAKDIQRISINNVTPELVLKYRGNYAKISGYDSKASKRYDLDIIPAVYNSIYYKDSASYSFFTKLINIIDSLDSESQIMFIDELLSNNATWELISNSMETLISSAEESRAVDLIKDGLMKAAAKGQKWEVLVDYMDKGIDISPYCPKLLSTLIAEQHIAPQESLFLRNVNTDILYAALAEKSLDTITSSFWDALYRNQPDIFGKLSANCDSIPDITRIYLYSIEKKFEHLLKVSDWESTSKWLKDGPPDITTEVVKGFIDNVDLDKYY